MPEVIWNAQNVVPDDIEPDLEFEDVLESIADDVLVGADGKLICTEEPQDYEGHAMKTTKV